MEEKRREKTINKKKTEGDWATGVNGEARFWFIETL